MLSETTLIAENALFWIVSSQHSHGEGFILRVTVFGEEAFKGVIKIKCKKGEALIQ